VNVKTKRNEKAKGKMSWLPNFKGRRVKRIAQQA